MSASLSDKFKGCLLGGMIGDVAGAVVEAESPGYIHKTFRDVDAILAVKERPEILGGVWKVGQFTDDTQQTLCVAEWLIHDDPSDAQSLLRRFAEAYEPWRGYGAGARRILENFFAHEAEWRSLATAVFPNGSFGNGSAMRVAPVGLRYYHDLRKLIAVARTSSIPTHCHPLAIQGAALQATAVAIATRSEREIDRVQFIRLLEATFNQFRDVGLDTTEFQKALTAIRLGWEKRAPATEMAEILGTGIEAYSAVPMAIYCFLANAESYERTITEAIFQGGDTDTIACMAGSISGAYLGESAVPSRWRQAVKEKTYTPDTVRALARELLRKAEPSQRPSVSRS